MRTVIEIGLFVILTTVFIGSVVAIAGGGDLFTLWLDTLVYVAVCSLAILPVLWLLIRMRRRLPRLVLYVLFALVVQTGAYGGSVLATYIIEGSWQIWDDGIGLSLASSLFVFGAVALYVAMRDDIKRQMRALQKIEMAHEQARRHELQAKLNTLQAKLNPHFLFNCLNTAAALIPEDTARAEEYVVKLAHVYRQVLSISDRTFIPLGEELDLIRDYADLERERFGDRLTLSVTCPDALRDWPISGLLIEPLVENAIKHNRDRERIAVEVTVGSVDGRIRIAVADNGAGFDPHAISGGYGLAGLRGRLELLYPAQDVLRIESAPGRGTRVALDLPVEPPLLSAGNVEREVRG